MAAEMDPARLQRRYAALTALRWLPTGLLIPVMVLLARARGLDVATIGLVGGAYGITAAALELPTGGLGDVHGRRPVLVASGLCFTVSTALLAVATGPLLFVASAVLRGAGRALGSGPLEAWLVDRLVDDPPAVARGLAAGHVAESVALGVGVVAGGAVTLVASGLPTTGDALLIQGSAPVLVATVLAVAWVVALIVWLPAGHPRARTPAGARTSDDAATSPRPNASARPDTSSGSITSASSSSRPTVRQTIAAALALARSDRPLRRLLVRMGMVGVVLVTLELFVPLLLGERIPDPAEATALFAALAAGAFAASAAGAAVGPRAGRSFGSAGRAAAWATGAVAPCLVAIGVGATPVLAVAYLLAYALLGVAGPLASILLHERVTARERTTVLSIESLALQAGGLVATLGLPQLVRLGPAAPWLAVAALVVAVAAWSTRTS